MTDHSNAIQALLAKYFKAYKPYDGETEQTMQALYEAVKGCVPEKLAHQKLGWVDSELDHGEVIGEVNGHNTAVEQALTNLRKLFGISKEGVDTE